MNAPPRPAAPAQGAAHAARSRFWIRTAVNFAVWCVAAALTASDSWLGPTEETMAGGTHSWLTLFVWHLSMWLPWMAVTPLIFSLARRFPPERGWTGALAAQMALSLLWVPGYTLVFIAEFMLWQGQPLSGYWTRVGEAFTFRLYIDVFLTWVIVAVAFASVYYEKYLERSREAAGLAQHLVRAELDALKAQLQPHFLFNTLNSISGLIRTGERGQALSVLAALSELLRYVLETRTRQLVPLERELEFIDQYLLIQRTRFAERLQVEIDVAEDCRALQVPSLLLQPLIENAVRHGQDSSEPNRVRLVARRTPEALELLIENRSGHGAGPAGFGIGLATTVDRLDRLYADAYRLELGRAEAGLTRLLLSLPLTVAPEIALDA